MHVGRTVALLLVVGASCGKSSSPEPGAPLWEVTEAHATSRAYSEAAKASLAGQSDQTPVMGGVHRRNFGEPASLNNILRSTYYGDLICREYLYPPLLRIGGMLDLEPLAAEARPTWSDDGKTMRWRLREGLLWDQPLEDGSPAPVTTRDAEYSWKMIQDPDVLAQRARGQLLRFSNLRILDERTFEVDVERPYFRAELDFGMEFRLMPAHLAEDTPEAFNEDRLGRQPVGYGPYRLEEWEAGRQITLVRREGYWTEGVRPFWLQRQQLVLVRDTRQNYELFMDGELGLCTIDDPRQWEDIQQDPAVQQLATFHEYFTPRINFVGWNHAHWALKEALVRRALTLLCPRERIRDDFYLGHAALPSGPWPLRSPEYDSGVDPLPFDPAGARRLLAEAGFGDADGNGVLDRDGQELSLRLAHPMKPGPALASGLLLYQDVLKDAGVAMELVPMQTSDILADSRAQKLDAFLLGFSLDPRDADLFTMYHSSQADGGDNLVSWKDDEMDRLLEAFRDEPDPAARQQVAFEIHRRFHDQQPLTLMPTPKALVLISSRYRNVRIQERGALMDDWWLAD